MPKAFFEGRIKLASQKSFKDKESGASIPRYTYFIQTVGKEDEPSAILQVNSKRDFFKLVDLECVFEVQITPKDGGGFWVTLVDAKPVMAQIKA